MSETTSGIKALATFQNGLHFVGGFDPPGLGVAWGAMAPLNDENGSHLCCRPTCKGRANFGVQSHIGAFGACRVYDNECRFW